VDLTSPKTIKELLSKYETRPSKGLGQNFLIDKNVLEKIIKAADIKPTDTILEVGPGIGTLTAELAEHAKQVIAVEKSETMCQILKETLSNYKNVEIINADILRYQLQTTSYKLVANIPYYITAPLIRTFLETESQPEKIILLVQKEVAQRICAKPPKMSLLAVSVQFYAEPKIISYVSKNCFLPAPKVDSSIIKITPLVWAHSNFASQERASAFRMLFFKIAKAGFSHPRKQLISNLSKGLSISKEKTAKWLSENNIDIKRRAETLSIKEWVALVSSL